MAIIADCGTLKNVLGESESVDIGVNIAEDFADFFHDKDQSVRACIMTTSKLSKIKALYKQKTSTYWRNEIATGNSNNCRLWHTQKRAGWVRKCWHRRQHSWRLCRFFHDKDQSVHASRLHHPTTSSSGQCQCWSVGCLWPQKKWRSWSAWHHAKPLNLTQLQCG